MTAQRQCRPPTRSGAEFSHFGQLLLRALGLAGAGCCWAAGISDLRRNGAAAASAKYRTPNQSQQPAAMPHLPIHRFRRSWGANATPLLAGPPVQAAIDARTCMEDNSANAPSDWSPATNRRNDWAMDAARTIRKSRVLL